MEDITFKNGNRLREWLIFSGSIIGMIITATLVWAALTGRVSALERESATMREEGTRLSQQNCKDIIAIRADVRYTRIAVDQINHRLEMMGGSR
jgi:hypothetical protein